MKTNVKEIEGIDRKNIFQWASLEFGKKSHEL